MNAVTVEDVPLDFKTPYEELVELRRFLTAQEIAEVTGLTRETISRARADQRFRRRTEIALRDLYKVVTRLRAAGADENGQLAAVLRREQTQFAGRSIADLLSDGQADIVLRALAPEKGADGAVPESDLDRRIEALLESDPVLDSRLGAIEAALLRHFGRGAAIERQLIDDYESQEPSVELYLRVKVDLPFGDAVGRLSEFLSREEALLGPVHRNLVIGFL